LKELEASYIGTQLMASVSFLNAYCACYFYLKDVAAPTTAGLLAAALATAGLMLLARAALLRRELRRSPKAK